MTKYSQLLSARIDSWRRSVADEVQTLSCCADSVHAAASTPRLHGSVNLVLIADDWICLQTCLKSK